MSILQSTFQLKQLPPLSLYIHIPWCIKKCPYCDFNSHSFKNAELPEAQYVDMLIIDLEQSLPLIWGRSIQSIFIGGGTPSLFSGEAINKLITSVRSRVNLSPYAEITIEVNPGTVERRYIADYAKAGVNRVSFGVQSFNNAHLKTLGRIHDSSQAVEAIKLAQQYFNNINLDIIYGLPNQTVAEALNDIETAIGFNTSHLSCYNLTIEPNTAFYKNVPKGIPDNDLCYIMQDALIDKLAANGYERYEISAYAKNKRYAQHNLNYWLFGDYLGIGAGAHSKLSFHDKIIRQARQKHPLNYMQAVLDNKHVIEDFIIPTKSLPFEFAMNAFRLIDGVEASLFVKYTGLSLNHILATLNMAQTKGFLDFKGDLLKPTPKGQDFLNDFLILFLEDTNDETNN
jgi:putative oxygen-independent coproporphyrinogen III oxidase